MILVGFISGKETNFHNTIFVLLRICHDHKLFVQSTQYFGVTFKLMLPSQLAQSKSIYLAKEGERHTGT